MRALMMVLSLPSHDEGINDGCHYPVMDYHKPEECSVCLISFDDDVRPRSLPCGHKFCSQCVNKAIKNGQLACPICRTQHSAPAASRFPINYGMEAFVRKLKHDELMAMGSQTGVARKKLRSVVKEQKSSISSVIIECEEVLSQLGEYRGQLNDWKTRHLQLQERLVEQNKAVMKLLEQEDDCVVTMTSRGEEEKTRLQAMLVNLDTVNAIDNADTIIDAAEKCNVEVQHWSQKCQALFPDVNTVHTSVKVQETIRKALDIMMTTAAGTTAGPVHLGDSANNIMSKVQDITGEIMKQIT
ncbi:tripartite motif-containing protein 59-like, partial [Procambarus clarkii]|uniref:tripartite motif-containing protein 59-like n=1 Tax=Procambarus clarkii TaxID=6728 RepID=UPI001E675024